MAKYSKLPFTYEEHVSLLESRGMIINDKRRMIRHLSNISYYRMSAYMLPYKKCVSGEFFDCFVDGTTWEKVYDIYLFDRKLRLLIFDAIERIEISVRTQIIYQLSHKYGSHWQDNPSIFNVRSRTTKEGDIFEVNIYKELQDHISKQLNVNKSEVFIKHYKTHYSEPTNPPSWMSIEVMYFSHLSRICGDLRERGDRVAISKFFDLPEGVFCSWLHTINYVRNLCAHHSRLWNRDLHIVPEKLHFSKHKKWITNPETVQRKKIYYFLCMLNYLLQTVNSTSSFKRRLVGLFEEYPEIVNFGVMGFPENWMQDSVWQEN